MTGKKAVFIIIIFTIIVLVCAWIWLQQIIKEYDLDAAYLTKLAINSLAYKIDSLMINK